jgi:type I restriction enzyme M protein
MLDSDIVEAVIQLPTDEFFNTGIYTYLWVLNKNKQTYHKDKVMLLNASDKFKPLKKKKGDKRKEIDEASRLEIVATLTAYQDNDYAKVFDKEFFYFNKQAIMLTNVDEHGQTLEAHLPMVEDKKTGELKRIATLKLVPTKITYGEQSFTQFKISLNENPTDETLVGFSSTGIQAFIANLEAKDSALVIHTEDAEYWYDSEQESIIKKVPNASLQLLGCGSILVKSTVKKEKKATKNSAAQEAYLEISVELTPDYQKDYEIIPFHKDEAENQVAIEDFMAKCISKPFSYLENVVGVEINFNKVFYKPEKLREVSEILGEITDLDEELKTLEAGLAL